MAIRQGTLLGTQAWRPDLRASLAVAVGGLGLVMALFVGLLRHQPDAEPAGPRLNLRVQQADIAAPRVREAPRLLATPVFPTLVTPSILLPPQQDFQKFLMDEAGAPEAHAGLLQQPSPALVSGLQKALSEPKSAAVLPDNQSFRIAGGGRMVRSGDYCAVERTLQGSSSPTNRITVAASVDCPESGQDGIAAVLEKWSAERARRAPVPPG